MGGLRDGGGGYDDDGGGGGYKRGSGRGGGGTETRRLRPATEIALGFWGQGGWSCLILDVQVGYMCFGDMQLEIAKPIGR